MHLFDLGDKMMAQRQVAQRQVLRPTQKARNVAKSLPYVRNEPMGL
jgi:hypothetical protein